MPTAARHLPSRASTLAMYPPGRPALRRLPLPAVACLHAYMICLCPGGGQCLVHEWRLARRGHQMLGIKRAAARPRGFGREAVQG